MYARHRMLARTISTDDKVAALSHPTAMLLWTWMIPHADNLGRMRGEAELVRLTCIPRVPGVTAKQVDGWLDEMAAAGLLLRYEVRGVRVIQLKTFAKHNNLRGNMCPVSDFPEYVQSTNGVHTACEQGINGVRHEVEGEGEGKGEGKEEAGPLALAAARLAAVFRPGLIEEMQALYPDRDVPEIARKVLEPRKRPVKDFNKALRNWCKAAKAKDMDRRIETKPANGAASEWKLR